MPKVAFQTFGCKVNQYETEKMIQDFLKFGFEIVDFHNLADVYVINTCTVTFQSDHKSRQAIRAAIKRNSSAHTVAMGCYVNWAKEEVKKLTGCDLTLTNEEKPNVAEIVIEKYFPELNLKKIASSKKQVFHTRALLKVEDGCDQFCSYCIVPYVRGKPRSRPLREVIKEAQELVLAGYKEIVVTGVRLGKYGQDFTCGEANLVGLLDELSKIKGLERIRLSSIEPTEVNSDLIKLFKDNQKLCKHLHVPLQSGSNKILSAMNRGYSREDYLKLADEIRSLIPEIAITTDVIVGFPDENKEDFLETKEVIEKIKFRKLHVFKYSPRPLTKAAKLKDNVSFAEKKKRSEELISLGEDLANEYVERFISRKLKVLVEKELDKDYLTGLSDNYIRVYFKGDRSLKGEIVAVIAHQIKDGCLLVEVTKKSGGT